MVIFANYATVLGEVGLFVWVLAVLNVWIARHLGWIVSGCKSGWLAHSRSVFNSGSWCTRDTSIVIIHCKFTIVPWTSSSFFHDSSVEHLPMSVILRAYSIIFQFHLGWKPSMCKTPVETNWKHLQLTNVAFSWISNTTASWNDHQLYSSVNWCLFVAWSSFLVLIERTECAL